MRSVQSPRGSRVPSSLDRHQDNDGLLGRATRVLVSRVRLTLPALAALCVSGCRTDKTDDIAWLAFLAAFAVAVAFGYVVSSFRSARFIPQERRIELARATARASRRVNAPHWRLQATDPADLVALQHWGDLPHA